MIRSIRPLCLFFTVLGPLSFGQEVATTLALKQPVGATLAAGDVDDYFIEAEAGQFVSGAADQKSVDVTVKVFGPDDAKLAEFDGPGVGPEPFSFETKTAGRYRIEVAPFEKAVGDYSITLLMLEPIAKTGPARVDQLMAAFSGDATPGGVVSVVQEGETLFEKAYGMANLVHAVPFALSTPSNLGSTSKQFTAFAISLLAAEGELTLDDDVRKHIPELPDLGETVTLRHLLTHTSGYREFLNTLMMGGRRLDEGDFIDRKELIEVVQRQPKLQNSPGSEWNYNNTGYGLLTVVVERVSGEEFPTWMKSHVFEPLGMTHTAVRANPSQIIPGSAQGYAPGAEGFRDSRDLGAAMGAGAIYSTVGDLAIWMRNLQTGEFGGAEILREMTTPYTLTSGESTKYGFGLSIDEQGSLRRIQHGGADSAHRAMLMVFPDIQAGVVALSNNASFDSAKIASKIAEAFFGDSMELGADGEGAVAEASAEKKNAFDPASFEPSSFDAFVGRYELEEAKGFILKFTRKDNHYFTQATGQGQLELTPTSGTTFKIQGVDAEVVFHQDEDGKCTSMTLNQNGSHKAKRLDTDGWAPNAEQLASYAGRYFSEELEAFFTLVVEDKQLVVQHRRLADMKLTPVVEHEFRGAGGQSITFVVSPSGAVWGLEVSNGRTRGVAFARVR